MKNCRPRCSGWASRQSGFPIHGLHDWGPPRWFDGDSHLGDLDRDELPDAVAAIDRLKSRFQVMNPRASLEEVARYIRGEPQAVPCVGGHKYSTWIGISTSGGVKHGRSRSARCSISTASPISATHAIPARWPTIETRAILMHAGVAASDAVRSLARGDIGATTSSLFRRGVGLPPSGSRAADADTQDSEGPNSCQSQRSLDCGL